MNVMISAETRDQLVALLEAICAEAPIAPPPARGTEPSRDRAARRHGREAAAILPHLKSASAPDLESTMDAIVDSAMGAAS